MESLTDLCCEWRGAAARTRAAARSGALFMSGLRVLRAPPSKARLTVSRYVGRVLEANPMANPFVHVELHTGDPAKAKAFYSKLFGWKLKDMPMPGGESYTMIDVGEGTGGGMMTAQPPGSPPR